MIGRYFGKNIFRILCPDRNQVKTVVKTNETRNKPEQIFNSALQLLILVLIYDKILL